MNSFTDPRIDPIPEPETAGSRFTDDPNQLSQLHQLCRQGRLYEVERWLREDRPLQLAEGRPSGRRRWSSALEIALENGNQALVLLLLCNGYDPSRERHSPLDRVLRDGRLDLLDVLLDWGADPHRVDLSELFGTYDSDLFDRFRELGVDLTEGHAMAAALGYHTSNKPLFGYAKRHRRRDPRIQTELDIALAHHTGEGNEKGVSLCLWAGADPHAPVPSLRYGGRDDDGEDSAGFVGFSAVYEACSRGRVGILEQLGPEPARDDFDDLYCTADCGAVIEFLAGIELPSDVGRVVRRQVWWATFRSGGWTSLWTLERLFEVGARWESSSDDAIAGFRRKVIKLPDDTFVDLMKLLAKNDRCSPDILQELARTPAMRRRMREVGFIPPDPGDPARSRWHRNRPTRFREVLKKCGIELEKPKRPLPRVVRIGRRRRNGREIRMDREALFECVWSDPVAKVAEEWGLSGRGLAKACSRVNVPVPPRGYWPKMRAGKKVRRPDLPELPEGQAEEIVVWAPE